MKTGLLTEIIDNLLTKLSYNLSIVSSYFRHYTAVTGEMG